MLRHCRASPGFLPPASSPTKPSAISSLPALFQNSQQGPHLDQTWMASHLAETGSAGTCQPSPFCHAPTHPHSFHPIFVWHIVEELPPHITFGLVVDSPQFPSAQCPLD